MIKKIIFSIIFVCLLIAIPLALLGIKRVELGTPFLSFMQNCSYELNDFKIAIPEIPHVPSPYESGAWYDFLRALVSMVNFIVNICNVAITFMNSIMQFFQFLFIVLKNLIKFRENLENYVYPVMPVI